MNPSTSTAPAQMKEEDVRGTCMYVGSWAKPGEYKIFVVVPEPKKEQKKEPEPEPVPQFDLSGVDVLMAKLSRSLIAEAKAAQEEMVAHQSPSPPSHQQVAQQWNKKDQKDQRCFDYISARGCQRTNCKYLHIDKENGPNNQQQKKKNYKKRKNGQKKHSSTRRTSPYY